MEDIVAGHSKVTFQRVYNENAQISAIQAIQAIDQFTKRLKTLNYYLSGYVVVHIGGLRLLCCHDRSNR